MSCAFARRTLRWDDSRRRSERGRCTRDRGMGLARLVIGTRPKFGRIPPRAYALVHAFRRRCRITCWPRLPHRKEKRKMARPLTNLPPDERQPRPLDFPSELFESERDRIGDMPQATRRVASPKRGGGGRSSKGRAGTSARSGRKSGTRSRAGAVRRASSRAGGSRSSARGRTRASGSRSAARATKSGGGRSPKRGARSKTTGRTRSGTARRSRASTRSKKIRSSARRSRK